ncbi:MAG: hypothetical protein KKA42_05580 [candidate division Zixibacteria bacterium]|nr:hypothetical protein [candidate division Zixibacteria bacterium]
MSKALRVIVIAVGLLLSGCGESDMRTEDGLDQSSLPPLDLDIFPTYHLVSGSQTYPSDSLPELRGLTDLRSAAYGISGDTLILWYTPDPGGAKYLQVLETAEAFGGGSARVDGVAYDDSYALVFTCPESGRIIAGLRDGYLVGVHNYRDEFRQNVAELFSGLTLLRARDSV